MLRIVMMTFLLLSSWMAFGAERLKVPTSEQATEQGKSVFAVEQRARERPIRFEQSCPPPEAIDVFQTSTWNTAEIGLSFPLGDGSGEAKVYSRYTCPNPTVKPRR